MRRTIFAYMLLYLFGCNTQSSNRKDMERIANYTCINNYINQNSLTPEHEILKLSAIEFVKCCYKDKLGINNTDTSVNVLIDDFILYSESRDTAIVNVIFREKSKDVLGFDYDVRMLFAYKRNNIWYFFNKSCPATHYFKSSSPSFTFEYVINQERLKLCIDYNWFNLKNCMPNYSVINRICSEYCGPCNSVYQNGDFPSLDCNKDSIRKGPYFGPYKN